MTTIYESGWSPPRTKPAWDRLSMGLDGAKRAYASWLSLKKGEPTEAVAWFGDDGACRQIVFAFGDGGGLLVQHQSRGSKVTFPRLSEALSPRKGGDNG